MSAADESARPSFATEMVEAQQPHMEILDLATQSVWQTIEPITMDEFKAFPLDEGFIKTGIGIGAMDEHWFEQSPGTTEKGAMDRMKMAGREFGFCAKPTGAPELPAGPDGPRRMIIDKHHVLRFRAGRSIPILRLPDGSEFVHVVEGGDDKKPLDLPGGWTLRHLDLESDWIVGLPAPTTVFFFPNSDSYQGPLDDLPLSRNTTG